MRALGTGTSALLGALVFAATAVAQPAGWQPSLEVARQQAAQTNRLVMVYFYNDACVYCKIMQRDVFSQKGVMDSLSANYTLVQVNADKLPAVAIQYGVAKLPTTVLTTPDGQMVDKIEGRKDAQQFMAQVNQTAAAKRPAMVAARPATPPPSSVPTPYTPPPPPVAAAGPQVYTPPMAMPPAASPAPATTPGAYTPPPAPPLAAMTPPATPTPAVAPTAAPVSSTPPVPPVVSNAALSGTPGAAPPVATPASIAPPAVPTGNPPLCLDGFCPVQLMETQRWIPGDRRYGLVHRGRTYLFTGQEERDRFNADPDKYAPVMSGNDIVVAVEQGQNIAGRREHGVFFGQRIYLFSSETSLERFSKNPGYYADQALQAMRGGAVRSMYR